MIWKRQITFSCIVMWYLLCGERSSLDLTWISSSQLTCLWIRSVGVREWDWSNSIIGWFGMRKFVLFGEKEIRESLIISLRLLMTLWKRLSLSLGIGLWVCAPSIFLFIVGLLRLSLVGLLVHLIILGVFYGLWDFFCPVFFSCLCWLPVLASRVHVVPFPFSTSCVGLFK